MGRVPRQELSPQDLSAFDAQILLSPILGL